MNVVITVALFLIGLALIIKGGDWFVDAATWIAEVSGIPTFLIGATIVSVATTLPELIVSIMAAAEGSIDMAVGNAIGSVTANTGLIMAISLIFMPVAVQKKEFSVKALLLIAAIALLTAFCLPGSLSFWGGIVIFLVFAAYIFENVRSAKQLSAGEEKVERRKPEKKETTKNIIFFIIGAAALVVGSRLLVDNGTIIAELLGVPERVIAVTMVAIGTSLPELVTAITALAKKQGSMSVGNIIGANVIDLTLILPICSLITGGSLPVSPQTITLDLPVCFAIILIATVPTMIRKKFSRVQGIAMAAIYVAYLVFTFI